MVKVMNVVKFAINTIKVSRRKADPIADYDVASETYDDFYSRHLGKKTLEFLDSLPLAAGQHVLDLPSGTGFLTARLAKRVGPTGSVQAVDLSKGMLERCRANTEASGEKGIARVEYVLADAFSHVKSLKSESLDVIVCAWGLCYLEWNSFIKECHRCLKKGGTLAIIENRKDSLSEISRLYAGVLMNFPSAMMKSINLDLPRSSDSLVSALKKSGFEVSKDRNGEVIVPADDGSQVVEYLRKAGVSSGFLDCIRKDQYAQLEEAVIAKLDGLIRKGKPVPLIHRFSTALGKK
jgi:ubiquinone/menaquinone biosynthesis C-methylase UbiE